VCTLFNFSAIRLPCISGYICAHLDARRACQHGISSITSEQEKVPVVFHRVVEDLVFLWLTAVLNALLVGSLMTSFKWKLIANVFFAVLRSG